MFCMGERSQTNGDHVWQFEVLPLDRTEEEAARLPEPGS